MNIEDKILQMAERKETAFPQSLENTIALRNLLIDPDASFNDIATRISGDPVISSAVINLVNSPLYGYSVKSVHTAVSLLGYSSLNFVVFGIIQKQLSLKLSPLCKRFMVSFWDYNLRVAGAAYALALLHSGKDSADEVLYTGMLLNLDTMFTVYAAHELGIDFCDSITYSTAIRKVAEDRRQLILQAYKIDLEVAQCVNFTYQNSSGSLSNSGLATSGEFLVHGRNFIAVPEVLKSFVSEIPESVLRLTTFQEKIQNQVIESFL